MDKWIRDVSARFAVLACIRQGSGYGHSKGRMRLSKNLDDISPVTLFALTVEATSSQTTLRNNRETGRSTLSVVVPRQDAFKLNGIPAPGLLLEPLFGTGQWWSVDEVNFNVELPSDTPVYTFHCSWMEQDPQPVGLGAPALNPVVSSIVSNSGPDTGGNTVQIVGTNFWDNATVAFGINQATNVVVLNNNTIVCTVPAGTAGLVSVTVTNTDAGTDTLANAYTYQPPGEAIPAVIPRSFSYKAGYLVFPTVPQAYDTLYADVNGVLWFCQATSSTWIELEENG